MCLFGFEYKTYYICITLKQKKMKVLVMKSAWELVKGLGLSLSEALVKAWKAVKLKFAMKKGTIAFKFLKKDGSIREALGTLKDLPVKASKGTKENFKTIAYWDIEAEGFRCFKTENLI